LTDIGRVGEEHFAAYLNGRRIPYERGRESNLMHRDFWVATPSGPIVCEVKSLTARPPAESGALDVYRPVRTAINRVARQGGGIKGTHPYVLVIYVPTWPTDPIAMSGAMFGNVGITFPVDPATGSGDSDASTSTFVRGGRIQPTLHTRFSAVLVVGVVNPGQLRIDREIAGTLHGLEIGETLERVSRVAKRLQAAGLLDDDERVERVDVYRNPFAELALPDGVFDGPYDRIFDVFEGRYSLVAQGISLEGFDD
jgi:hypothetical protein